MTLPHHDDCVPFPCPHCGTEIQKTVGWLLHNTLIGCGCGAHLRIDASELRAGLDSAAGAAGAD